MNKIDSIIFDLDGTLWDSRNAVAKARNSLSRKFQLNLPEFTIEDVQKTMGFTLDKVYQVAFSTIPFEQFANLRSHLDFEISSFVMSDGASLFNGVGSTLEALSEHLPLYIVSNCSTKYLETFLAWSKLRNYFKDFLCNGDNGLPKAQNIARIVQRNNLKSPVYVGDTSGDHQASVESGVHYIHVNYGFGQPNGNCTRIDQFSRLLDLLSPN